MSEFIARRAPEGHPSHRGPIIQVYTVDGAGTPVEVYQFVEQIDHTGSTAEQALTRHGYTPVGEWAPEAGPGTVERLHLTRYRTPAHVETAIREAIGPLPLVKTPDSVARYFDRRAAFCLEAADNTAALAQTVLKQGQADHARELADESRDFLAEAQRIDAMRTKPVLS
ncbi:hypothetical protein [Nocardia sp. IFM 10818]